MKQAALLLGSQAVSPLLA